MQTNKASLPVMSVQGKVDHPIMSGNGYRVGYDGYGRIPMATGGIIYNYKIGDSCMGIAGGHIEPGVSLKNAGLCLYRKQSEGHQRRCKGQRGLCDREAWRY